ncbi:MAG: hypothetical protein GEEBNDBF_01340 [bacterium]|nr:hypothetical protein [bacterium]
MAFNRLCLLTSFLCAASLMAGCDGGELAGNPDDQPQILSVRFIEGSTERTSSASGEEMTLVTGVAGPNNACRDRSFTVLRNSYAVAVYISVPNTQAPLDVDAFLTLQSRSSILELDPVQVSGISDRRTVYNKPGSAKGVIRVVVQMSNLGGGDSSGSTALCTGASGQARYTYGMQVVVVDPRESTGDSLSLPITFTDNTGSFCKASNVLCP